MNWRNIILIGFGLFGLVSASIAGAATLLEDIITSADGVSGDQFGYSVDIDGNTLVVGARYADVGGEDKQGALYVYDYDGNDWDFSKKITVADGDEFDQLGYAVGIAGDTIIAGAEEAQVGGVTQGKAYIFERNEGGADQWGLTKTLTESITSLDEYGNAVAIDGDTVVVGAPKVDNGGKTYVYYRDQGGAGQWGLVQELTDDVFDTNAEFGTELALAGDLLVVGATSLDVVPLSFENEGAVLVFGRNEGDPDNWGQLQKLIASDADSNDRAGNYVAIDGTTIVMGAVNAAGGGGEFSVGKAYVFTSPSGAADSWSEAKILTAADGDAFHYFGNGAAVVSESVFVGALGHASNRGKVYQYDKDEGGTDNWGEADTFLASDGTSDDYFGEALAYDNGHLVVGANGNGAGAVYVYEVATGVPTAIVLEDQTTSNGSTANIILLCILLGVGLTWIFGRKYA